jgi:hypothetical protein
MEAKRDTKSAGDRSEIKIMCALVGAGYVVLTPVVGENHRYDLVIDDGTMLLKVQVKTGRLRAGAVEFNCYSSHAHHGGPSCRTYAGQVDCFGVYCPQLDTTYLVPIGALATFHGSLRVAPTKNGQDKHVRWADEYRIRPLETVQVGAALGSGVQGEAPKTMPL